MELIRKYSNTDFAVSVYGTPDKPMFKANEIGHLLDLKCIRQNIHRLPSPLLEGVTRCHGQNFISESVLYYIVMRSNATRCVDFQLWLCNEVLPSLRKTGKYELLNKENFVKCEMTIKTEFDLHKAVISYLKKYHPSINFLATLGEMQDTTLKRSKAYHSGYIGGTPDICILDPHKKYNGFFCEFKSPSACGQISDNQKREIQKYRDQDYHVVVSNNYDDIIRALNDYIKDIRIKCQHCNCKFKNISTLKNHHKYFHRMY